MKIIPIIIVINFLFNQGNYQILNSPSSFEDIFKYNQIENNEYKFFHTSFPAQIDFYSIEGSLDQIFKYSGLDIGSCNIYLNFESLDYGNITDNSNNYSFTANENLMKIKINNKLNNQINTMIKLGFLESNIEQYNSSALLIDAMISYKLSSSIINLKFENFGKVIKKYTSSNIDLPSIISLSYIKVFNPVSIIVNYEYDINLKQDLYSMSSQFNINNNLQLYLGIDNNKKSIIYGNYIEELISGVRSGIKFKYSDYIFYLAIQNMGAAGYSTSISLRKLFYNI